MLKTAEIWIVDKDEVLAHTLASMLVVNDLTSNFKVFNNLNAVKNEINNKSHLPQAILAENTSKENYWEFASDLKKKKTTNSPNIYFMGYNFENNDLDEFEKISNVKRLFKKPLRLDELKWIVEELK